MGELLEVVTPLHKSTTRDYLERMNDNKAAAMVIAKRYDEDYWDGERKFGYGGYRYIPGRWQPVAEALIKYYGLSNASSILDVGCGKCFLLFEIQKILPNISLTGIDISDHALDRTPEDFRGSLLKLDAAGKYPFEDGQFDLVISLGTLHNFRLPELSQALSEIERVSQRSYVMVESYRNELEMFNLECWALTAESILDPGEWTWFFDQVGFSGDYEFIYFE